MTSQVNKLSMSLDEIAKSRRKQIVKPKKRTSLGGNQTKKQLPTKALKNQAKKKTQPRKLSQKSQEKIKKVITKGNKSPISTKSKPASATRPEKSIGPLSTGTFVRIRPLMSDVLEADLRKMFHGYGKIKFIKFRDFSSRAEKREADVKFSNRKEAEAVVEDFNDREIDGITVRAYILEKGSPTPSNASRKSSSSKKK